MGSQKCMWCRWKNTWNRKGYKCLQRRKGKTKYWLFLADGFNGYHNGNLQLSSIFFSSQFHEKFNLISSLFEVESNATVHKIVLLGIIMKVKMIQKLRWWDFFIPITRKMSFGELSWIIKWLVPPRAIVSRLSIHWNTGIYSQKSRNEHWQNKLLFAAATAFQRQDFACPLHIAGHLNFENAEFLHKTKLLALKFCLIISCLEFPGLRFRKFSYFRD